MTISDGKQKNNEKLMNFKKEKEFDFKIDRKNTNFIRRTIGEHIGYQYIVETILPRGNNEKIIRIICNQGKTREMNTLHLGKSKIEQFEGFKETFSEIISHHSQTGGLENFSNPYVIVKDFHKVVFSTRNWRAGAIMSFSKYKVKSRPTNEIIVDSNVGVKLIKKIIKPIPFGTPRTLEEIRAGEDHNYGFSLKDNSIDDEIKKCFCVDSSNLEEIINNLENLYGIGFSPDGLLMDFKIYDSCEIDVELWHTQPVKNTNHSKTSVKKLKRIVPLVKLDKIIPIEMKTIPIKNSSFTQNQKKFIEYVHDNPNDILKPIILHIPLDDIFSRKMCQITEYSLT